MCILFLPQLRNEIVPSLLCGFGIPNLSRNRSSALHLPFRQPFPPAQLCRATAVILPFPCPEILHAS